MAQNYNIGWGLFEHPSWLCGDLLPIEICGWLQEPSWVLQQPASPHYSRGFVTKPLRRVVRRASTAGKEGSILEQYVDRLSGEHARRNSVSAVAVEAFVNNAG